MTEVTPDPRDSVRRPLFANVLYPRIERCERFTFAAGLIQKLSGPHILGIARRR